MKTVEFLLIGVLLVVSLMQTGCASFNRKLKAFLSGRPTPVESTPVKTAQGTRFSEQADMPPRVRRNYKRTTRESLAEEAALADRSGSLWVMEGQGAYLFSQNIVRLVGDAIPVQIEGDPKEQLVTKVNIIKKLLAKIDERQRARLRQPAEAQSDSKGDKKKGEKSEKAEESAAANQKKEGADDLSTGNQEFSVKNVPARITERLSDGNYRIKGMQPFMVGSREYKVIVTGIVRAEEFNDEGISSSKLIDPKFDIVSARRKEGEM